jgi:hypothetical protein
MPQGINGTPLTHLDDVVRVLCAGQRALLQLGNMISRRHSIFASSFRLQRSRGQRGREVVSAGKRLERVCREVV